MPQCKHFKEKELGLIVNCPNCERWNGERCKDEPIVVASQDLELVESLALCVW